MESATCEIRPEILYSLGDVQKRLGWGRHALRQARRNGLRIRYTAGRGYVVGRDIIAYIEANGKDEK